MSSYIIYVLIIFIILNITAIIALMPHVVFISCAGFKLHTHAQGILQKM